MSTQPPREPDDHESPEIVLLEREETKKPRRYAVILHNDDYTSMEFVVEVLMKFFRKSVTEAERIMLEVHYHGRGIAGVFPRDVAETKAEQVVTYARESGHPLLATPEPEEE